MPGNDQGGGQASDPGREIPAMTAERFAGGLPYREYVDQMTQNQERVRAHEGTNVLAPEDVAVFAALPDVIRVVALTEDWCSDAVATLPLVAALAERSGKLDLRVFFRDKNPDLMDAHLKEGKFRSIPTLIFYDEAWTEIGSWLEKPRKIDELRTTMRREIYASDPAYGEPGAPFAALPPDVRERLSAAYWWMRDSTTPLSNTETVRELRALLMTDER